MKKPLEQPNIFDLEEPQETTSNFPIKETPPEQEETQVAELPIATIPPPPTSIICSPTLCSQ